MECGYLMRRPKTNNANSLILFVARGQTRLAAVASAAPVQKIGAYCACLVNPGEPSLCTPELIEAECNDPGGWWVMAQGHLAKAVR